MKTNNIKDGECLFPDCHKGVAGRGLCPNHYHSAARLVQIGKTTWEKLEKAGRSKPTKVGGARGEVQSWFLEGQ